MVELLKYLGTLFRSPLIKMFNHTAVICAMPCHDVYACTCIYSLFTPRAIGLIKYEHGSH